MTTSSTQFEEKEAIVIRFAGDSGDGMQTVGEQFTDTLIIILIHLPNELRVQRLIE